MSQPSPSPSKKGGDEGVYEFVERGAVFNFYGHHLFVEAMRQMIFETGYWGPKQFLLAGTGTGTTYVEEIHHLKQDVYDLSSEAEMMAAFFREALF